MKKVLLALALLGAVLAPAWAKNYSDLKTSLKAVLPAGQPVFQAKLKLTAAQAKELNAQGQADFWAGDEFTLFYTKGADGKADRVAVEILEILSKYQAMHTWVISLGPDGSRWGLSVLELTDHYSYPLADKAYLARFPSRAGEKNAASPESIDVVAGATESSFLLRSSVKRVGLLAQWAGLR